MNSKIRISSLLVLSLAGSPYTGHAETGLGTSTATTPRSVYEDTKTPFCDLAGHIWPMPHDIILKGFDGDRSQGVDLMAAEGTPVVAAQDGTVGFAKESKTPNGKVLMIKHDLKFVSVYGYLSDIKVKQDEVVKRGQLVALTGRGDHGPMLHFQLHIEAKAINPMTCLPGDRL